MQGKLDEFGKKFDLTSTDLEKTKLENKKLREELLSHNAKFQDMYDILQQEDKDILCSLVKQKVDIDSHQAALKRVMELLCEEGNKHINLSRKQVISQNLNHPKSDHNQQVYLIWVEELTQRLN